MGPSQKHRAEVYFNAVYIYSKKEKNIRIKQASSQTLGIKGPLLARRVCDSTVAMATIKASLTVLDGNNLHGGNFLLYPIVPAV